MKTKAILAAVGVVFVLAVGAYWAIVYRSSQTQTEFDLQQGDSAPVSVTAANGAKAIIRDGDVYFATSSALGGRERLRTDVLAYQSPTGEEKILYTSGESDDPDKGVMKLMRNSLEISPTGRFITVVWEGGDSGQRFIFDTVRGEELHLKTYGDLGLFITGIKWSPDDMSFQFNSRADKDDPRTANGLFVYDAADQTIHPVSTSTSAKAFSVTPTSGPAPLAVTTSDFNFCDFNTIDWGDQSPIWNSYSAQRSCEAKNPMLGNTSHTYTTPGTYAVVFSHPDGTIVTTQNITAKAPTFSATPTSGSAPLTVTFNPPSLEKAFYELYYGDTQSGYIDLRQCGVSASACGEPDDYSNFVRHTYTSAGVYSAKLIKLPDSCMQGALCSDSPDVQVVASITITVGK